jgi:hypothetical protein
MKHAIFIVAEKVIPTKEQERKGRTCPCVNEE